MRVLAIDTALEACSAAVLDSERADGLTIRSVPMQRGHAEALMPLVAEVMGAAGVAFADLDRIAVTVGPGSFTGLRVGVAAARAIALASGKPATGVTTLTALAAPFFTAAVATTTARTAARTAAAAVTAAAGSGAVMSVIDARHERVYMQLFGPTGRSLAPPCIAAIASAADAALARTALIVGNAARTVEAVFPSGARTSRALCVRAPDIAVVARLGAQNNDLTTPVRPLYLSEADARPQEAGILPRR